MKNQDDARILHNKNKNRKNKLWNYIGGFLEIDRKMTKRKKLPDTLIRPYGIFQWYSDMVQILKKMVKHIQSSSQTFIHKYCTDWLVY